MSVDQRRHGVSNEAWLRTNMCDFNLASEQASRESMFPCLSDERSNMHRKNSSRMAREGSLISHGRGFRAKTRSS